MILNLELIPKGCDSSIDIYLRPKSAADTPVEKDENGNIISVGEGSKKVATVQLDATMPRTKTKVSVPITADSLQELDEDKYGLFFVFNSEMTANICDLYTMEFEADNTDVTEQKAEVIGEAIKATVFSSQMLKQTVFFQVKSITSVEIRLQQSLQAESRDKNGAL